MCLAVPMLVERVDGARALVRTGGLELWVALDLVDRVTAGSWVIVHVGYAIQVLTAEEAHETLAILDRLTS